MDQAIGDILPLAIGVAISPVPIIAVVLMLGTPRGRTTGVAFALGWVAGLAIVGTVVLLVERERRRGLRRAGDVGEPRQARDRRALCPPRARAVQAGLSGRT